MVEDPDIRAAGDSTVRVLGTACGLGVAGSGWVAEPGIVVTNAHVVAGADDTTVSTEGGPQVDATAVHYEPRNDLAVLEAPGLDAPPLELAPEAPSGAEGGGRLSRERPADVHPGTAGARAVTRVRMPRTDRAPDDARSGRGAQR